MSCLKSILTAALLGATVGASPATAQLAPASPAPTSPAPAVPSVPAAPAAPASPPAVIPTPSQPQALTPARSATEIFRSAKSWGYQLSGLKLDTLAKSPLDILVIDYSHDAEDNRGGKPFSEDEIARLRIKPDGSRRIVLAYLSVGEAENYRFYWNKSWDDWWFIPNFWSKPSWRAKLNGDWGGNYAVRYWDPAWQKFIIGDDGYLDRILKAGFDGVWLDKVDSALEDVAAGRATARAEMVAFVKAIAERGRVKNPEFLVVPQNGEQLLVEPGYSAIIDGMGKESLLVGEDGANVPNSEKLITERAALLAGMTTTDKPVLAVEYIGDPTRAKAATERIAKFGFLPLIAKRELDLPPGIVTADAGDSGARKSPSATTTSSAPAAATTTKTSATASSAPASSQSFWGTVLALLLGLVVLIAGTVVRSRSAR